MKNKRSLRLATLLLHKRAWGNLSATAIQQLAATAVADGAKCSHLERLAKIGDSGRFPGNCERDLQLNLQSNVFASALKSIRMPTLNPMQIIHSEQHVL